MRIDSRERRRGTNPVYSPSLLTSPHGPTPRRSEVRLKFRGCAAKVLYAAQLPRRSSSRVGAVQRDEREGEERGKSEPRSFSIHSK